MSLIKCTECGKEISDKADKCPNCGAPVKKDSVYVSRPTGQLTPQPKKKSNKGTIIAVIIVAIVLIGLFGGSDESETNSNPTENVKEESIETKENVESEKIENTVANDTKEEKEIYSVGDVYENKYIKMKYINSYEFTEFNEFNQPKDGYMIICAEFEVENISDSDQTVMYTDFNGYADGYEVEQSYSPEGTGLDFSLNMSAGRKGKGIVAFEVPVDANEIQIEFSPNIWSSEKVVFSYK